VKFFNHFLFKKQILVNELGPLQNKNAAAWMVLEKAVIYW
jgi:hypothetical protein